jgi:hypothetical protein
LPPRSPAHPYPLAAGLREHQPSPATCVSSLSLYRRAQTLRKYADSSRDRVMWGQPPSAVRSSEARRSLRQPVNYE